MSDNNKIEGGAVIFARQTINSDIFFYKPDKWFKIFFYIVLRVNHKDNKQFKRGECFIKYEWIMDNTKATKSEVDHCIRWLKNCKMLATRKATRGMVITVLNYDKYQCLDNYKSDTKGETKGKQKGNKSDTINKNGKNEKNNIEVFSSSDWIDQLLSDTKKHIAIIGLFAKKRGSSFASKEEGSAFIGRWSKEAVSLSCYSLEQIGNTMNWLDQQNWDSWTLKAVGTYIDQYKDYTGAGGIKYDTRYPDADVIIAKELEYLKNNKL